MEKLLHKEKLEQFSWVFLGIKLPNYRKRIAIKTTILLHSVICTGQIYPSQVAPQQSLLPFQFDKAKIKKSLFVKNKKNYFCKLISGLKNDCKLISGFSKLLSILHVLTCKLFLGRVKRKLYFFYQFYFFQH